MIDLKEKLQKRELTIGSWITIGSESIAEIMAQAGFDWLTIDMEHGAITFAQALQLIRTIELSGCVPLVRVSENKATYIKRVMDAGAHGVIVPMVNSVEEARAAVAAVKYPPQGTRGVGLARAQCYGLGFAEYKSWVAEKSVVIVQIEHIDAVNNLSGILGVEGVDGFIIGPYDLSGSLGKPGDFTCSEMKAALAEVDRAAKQMNAVMGYHSVPTEVEAAQKLIDEGYTFVAVGVDELYLANGCGNLTTELKQLS